MKLASYQPSDRDHSSIGVLVGDTVVDLPASSGGTLPNDMIAFLGLGEGAMRQARDIAHAAAGGKNGRLSGGTAVYRSEDVKLLAPVPRPGKIIHTACNFTQHLEELTAWKAPEWRAHDWGKFHYEHPTGFLEAPSSVVGSGARVERPIFTKQLDYEIEIGIVIGRYAKNVPLQSALDHVAGYTVFNDLSARDIQAREHANKVVMLGKSFDGSCPFGPFLVTRDEIPDPAKLEMTLRVNGEIRQQSSTAQMRFKPAELVSFWSLTTLEPGDIITSGSPPGVAAGMEVPRWLQPGDTIEATVEGIGTLVTYVTEPQ